MSLKHDFSDDFASTAFRDFAGDKAIVGKWGAIVEMDDGSYDAWFVDTRDGPRPLTGRRIGQIRKNLPKKWGLVELDGEAYAKGRGPEFVREVAILAGVRRRRRMSAEAKARAAERLKRAREAA